MRRKMLSALLVVPLLAMVLGCDWDEKLPFRGNELDAGLLGFWWRVLPDTAYDLAVRTQALIEFRREGEENTMRMWRAYGGDECPHVEGNSGFHEAGKTISAQQRPGVRFYRGCAVLTAERYAHDYAGGAAGSLYGALRKGFRYEQRELGSKTARMSPVVAARRGWG